MIRIEIYDITDRKTLLEWIEDVQLFLKGSGQNQSTTIILSTEGKDY